MDTSAGVYRIYAQNEREGAREHTHMVVKNVSPLLGVVGIVCEQIRRKRKCIVVVLWTVIMWPLLKVSGSAVHHKGKNTRQSASMTELNMPQTDQEAAFE